jgi:hypothetical protein
MGTVVRIPFEVTGWEPEPLDLGGDGPVAFSRVTLRKTFSGPMTGSFVLQHSGVVDGTAQAARGVVLPGTATGDLAGLRGTVELTHEADGAVLVLDYEVG